MVRPRGRCERGSRLIDTTPHGHWKTSTFIAALREDGLIAPAVFDCAINADLFLCYIEQILVADVAGRRHRRDGLRWSPFPGQESG